MGHLRRVVLLVFAASLVATVVVAGQAADAPQPRLTVSPLQGTPGTEFRADATFSRGSPLEGGGFAGIVKYEWDWNGTGAFVEGRNRDRFVYAEAGEYVVAVRITDDTGAIAAVTQAVSVGAPTTGFRWNIVIDNAPLFWAGLKITLLVSVVAIVAGLPLGVVVGLARISRYRALRWPASAYVEFLRGTPLLVQIFIVVFALPEVGLRFGALVGGIVALTINTSAYQAEIIRSGIQAIPSGQMEAALGMGLTHWQAMREVILPQALRLVIPPLTNEFIILIKDSSLVSLIGVLELMGWARVIGSRTFRVFEPFIAVALIYFVLTYSLSLVLQWVERKLAIPGLGMKGAGVH